MPAPTLQFKRGLFANLPGLRAGEPGFTTDSYELYIGINSTTQENKFFGSHRYWTRETTTTGSGVNFVEGTNNGTDFITIKAPGTLAGIVTFTLPGADGSNGQILTTNGTGTLSFSSPSSSSFTIAGGTGTDTFNTGGTLTFAGTANEIETAVTNDQVQIGLPDNVIVGGALTVTTGAVIDGVQIGINGANVIDTVSGNLTLNSAGGQTIIDDVVTIQNNLTVNGNVTIGGTTVNLRGTDVFIENKDIVLGFTTSVTPNDDTANHAGVAIASTEGSPLVSFTASGINTLPNTYKQLMWFKSGTLGFATDAFAFNYGVAIGTTTMANGVRLAVGTGVTVGDTSVSATNFYGALTGNVTGTASSTTNIPNLTGAITSNNTTTSLGSFSSANLSAALTDETGSGVAVFATSPTLVTPVLGAATGTSLNLGNINLESNGNATILGQLELGNASDTTITRVSAGVVAIEGVNVVTVSATQTLTNKTLTSPILTTPVLGDATATSINVSGITTTGTLTLSGTPGIGITGISSSTSLTENSHTFLPTQAAVKAYVDAVDVTLGINADTGGASTVATSQTLTISGTANEVNTAVSGQTITVGLPDSVTVTTALTTPTINATNLKANDGTTAITITNSTGAVATNSDLTVGGNLYVNGSTTQVNTAALTVEDRTIDLGIVNGAAPAGTTTWDLGILFNYYATTAKKSAVIWEHGDARFKFASVLTADTDGSTVDTPQLTVTTFAPVEIGQLWVTDCAGTSQVISCTGTTRNLENITIDGGQF